MPCSDVGAEGDCEGQGQEPGRRQDEVALIRTSTSEHYQGGADDRSWPELRQLRPTDRSRPILLKNSICGGGPKFRTLYSQRVLRDTRGQRLQEMSAVSGRALVVYGIARVCQLTRSLGGEMASCGEASFSTE